MKTFLAIVLTFLLTAAIAGGAVYYWQEQRYHNAVPAEQLENTNQVNRNTVNRNQNINQPTPSNMNTNATANENTNTAETNENANRNANSNTNQTTRTGVNLYFIALDDQGQNGEAIGCGDSLIPLTTTVMATGTETKDKIRAALTALFTYKTESATIGNQEYYNALYQSNLEVADVQMTDGLATVELTGTYTLGGECDNPRFAAQLEQTVLQFPGVESAQIRINDESLSDVISLQ